MTSEPEDALATLLRDQAKATLALLLSQVDANPVRALGLLQYCARRYNDMLGEVSDVGASAASDDEIGGLIVPRRRNNGRMDNPASTADMLRPTVEAQRIAALTQAIRHGNPRVVQWANRELERMLPPEVAAAGAEGTGHPLTADIYPRYPENGQLPDDGYEEA